MLKSIIKNKKIHITILLLNSAIFSLVYIYNQPIDFHCDSATFYNYASGIARNFYKLGAILLVSVLVISVLLIFFSRKFVFSRSFLNTKTIIYALTIFIILYLLFIIISINSIDTPYSIYSFSRPPIYPITLFLSGIFFFDTFYVIIFLQAILSLITIYLIYSIFAHLTYNKQYAFIMTLLYGITSIPYILIKFISAEQLMYFFVILTFYSIVSFHKERKYFFIYIGLFSSILCWLTKWEGQLVFIGFISYLILHFVFSKNKKFLIKHFIAMAGITLIVLSIWTVTRSVVTKDFSTVFNVSNSTMDQSMWRFYSSLPSTITIFEKALKIEKENTGKFISEIYPSQPAGTIIIHKDNGKYSRKLFELIDEILQEYPNSYEYLKKPLKEAYNSGSKKNIDFYYELFGKFKNNSEIVENMMHQPNIYYFNFWDPKLTDKIGRHEKDKLYKKAIRESLINNPTILLTFTNNMLKAYGIDFYNYILYNRNPYSNINNVSFLMPYNAGKCAENNLTPAKFKEYKNSYDNYNNYSLFKMITEFNDSINDFIRNYFGIMILIACIVILFNDFILFLPLTFIPTSLAFAVSVLVDSPTNSKYEVIIFSANYILLGYFVFLVIKKFLKLFNKNYG